MRWPSAAIDAPTVRRVGAGMLIAVALIGLLPGCGEPESKVAPAEDAPTVEHVHGLGVNPADGALFAATHFGLFRITSGGAHFVGEKAQDIMGFTVLRADHFLASGHPDFRYYHPVDGEDPLLGLIESTDGGESWSERSLGGKADFHGLAARGEWVFGWSATTGDFMVTRDKQTWETHSNLSLTSFAVDTDDVEWILASGEEGLRRSGDGGRTWTTVAGGPSDAFLATGPGREVWAAGRIDGAIAVSEDGGSTWQPRTALPGRAEAVVVQGDVVFAAVTGVGIVSSTDAGETWGVFYRSA